MRTLQKSRNMQLLLFVAPALIVFTIVKLIPIVYGMMYSLTAWNGIDPSYRWIGLENYKEIFTMDPAFWQSIAFTLQYSIAIVICINLLAVFLAISIESLKRTRSVFRTIFFLPNMISLVIGGYMWNFIFTQVVFHFSDTWGLTFLDQSWIGDPAYSFYAILLVALWGGTGYIMVIYIAALQSIPESLHEAAIIDGASPFQRLHAITLPMIRQAFTICIFISLNNAFQVFDVVYSLTGGGPGRSTQVVALNIYEEAFQRSNRFGYASAKSTILFLILLAVTATQLIIMKRKEQEL